MIKTKNQKIMESFELTHLGNEFDQQIMKKMLQEIVTHGIKFADNNDINNQDVSKLAQLFPSYFES